MTEPEFIVDTVFKSIVLLLSVFCTVSAAHAYTIADVKDPPGARVTYVGDVIQNGLPMQMKQFSADYTMAELLGFYKQRWSDAAHSQENIPAYIEKKVGEWQILSKVDESSSVVVQVKIANDGVSSEGYISVTDLSKKKETNQWLSNFPRPRDSQLISSTESVDKGRSATTLIIVNNFSVDENSEYYRSNMDALGWNYQRGGVKNNISMLHFFKDRQQCEITVTEADDGKTVIFANLIEINENS
ncbi:MAG: hypothetical protein KZQ94_16965 [Candidatus Thiodiazotropha sp. (ex Troendleina suluensis)]|nr:hypothetical protein [Candidatus Thiodiazotropha sp. (ex Troendleina suluensis)]